MSHCNTDILPIICSNSILGQGRESPDLLCRWLEDKSLKINYAETNNDSPANSTLVIISDDDTESLDSDITIILKPDIIVDYVSKPSPSKQDTDPIASCSTIEQQQQTQKKTQFLRCKSLKELLSNYTEPPKFHAKDHYKSRNDYKNRTTSGKIRGRRNISPVVTERCNNSNSDSSSSIILLSPTSKRSKHRQRNMIHSKSPNDDSDDAFRNTVRIQQHSKLKQLPSRANGPTKSTNKFNNYRRVMTMWSIHEAIPPITESDCSDDDSKVKRRHKLPEKTLCSNRKSPNPSALQDYMITPRKCALDNHYVLKNSKNSITCSTKSTKSRGVNVKPKSLLNNKKSFIHDPSIRNIFVDKNNRLKSEEMEDKVFSNVDKEDEEVPDETTQKGSYRKWMQWFPKIEEKMMEHRDFPTGVKYLDWERIGMLWFLLKSKNIQHSRSRKTWAKMIENGYLRHRSMRSLHNHFERKILPNIHDYNLPADVVEEFEAIMH